MISSPFPMHPGRTRWAKLLRAFGSAAWRAVLLPLLLLFLLPPFGAAQAAPAARQTFGIASYALPQGFSADPLADKVILKYADPDRQFFIIVSLYAARPAAGSLEASFAREWKLTAGTLGAEPPAATKPDATPEGVPYLDGSTLHAGKNGPMPIVLRTYQVGRQVVSVLVVVSSPAAAARAEHVVEPLIDSLRFAGTSGAERTAPAQEAAATPGGKALWKGEGVVGVWIGMQRDYNFGFKANAGIGAPGMKTRMQRLTFLADGRFYEGLPEDGLQGAGSSLGTKSAGQPTQWGSWHLDKGRIVARSTPQRTLRFVLQGDVLKEEQSSPGDSDYYRAAVPDGMRLHGVWSTHEKWRESSADADWTSVPVIQFFRDGQFVDRGAFMYLRSEALTEDNAERHPGRGSYEIQGYTLALRYNDGRVVRRSFTGLLRTDPSKDNDLIYVHQIPLHKQ